MLNKIDKRLLSKIEILSTEKTVDIIVHTDDIRRVKKLVTKYAMSDVCDLPIISSIAMKTKIKDIFLIAREKSVLFVSSDYKVCSLIYNSKKIINSDKLITSRQVSHTCVVIDTGVYPHIDFCLGKNRIIKFVDLINNESQPYDDNGHGTFVVGVLGGNSITSKYSGIDNYSNIIVIKALDKDGETSSLTILKAMQWVLDNREKFNIKVVCMSFGSQVVEIKDPLMYGAEVLWDNGIVVVSAGGNSGPDAETIMSPGASRKIITVGAMATESGEYSVAHFSSRGPAFGNFKPDFVVPGVDIVSTNLFPIDKKFYTSMSGTSVSAPMVAGVVSKILRINPNYTPNQIKYMLSNSCIQLNGDRNAEGFGRLDLSYINFI